MSFLPLTFPLDIFAPTDATLQPRPVANRQYYTLPNSGAGVERRTSAPPVSISVESPRFHPHAKGKNIRLDGQLRRATRKNSFCNGITFSHRPVHLYEKVCFHFFVTHCVFKRQTFLKEKLHLLVCYSFRCGFACLVYTRAGVERYALVSPVWILANCSLLTSPSMLVRTW